MPGYLHTNVSLTHRCCIETMVPGRIIEASQASSVASCRSIVSIKAGRVVIGKRTRLGARMWSPADKDTLLTPEEIKLAKNAIEQVEFDLYKVTRGRRKCKNKRAHVEEEARGAQRMDNTCSSNGTCNDGEFPHRTRSIPS